MSYNGCYILLFFKIKMIIKKLLISLTIVTSLLLVSCWKETTQTIEADKWSMDIPIEWKTVSTEVDKDKEVSFEILGAYKESSTDDNIGKFKWSITIAKDVMIAHIEEKEYMNNLQEKLIRNIIGAWLIDSGDFSIGDYNVYYSKFSVKDNMFDNIEKIAYFWLQFNIPNVNKIYTITAISEDENQIDSIYKMIKNSLALKN